MVKNKTPFYGLRKTEANKIVDIVFEVFTEIQQGLPCW